MATQPESVEELLDFGDDSKVSVTIDKRTATATATVSFLAYDFKRKTIGTVLDDWEVHRLSLLALDAGLQAVEIKFDYDELAKDLADPESWVPYDNPDDAAAYRQHLDDLERAIAKGRAEIDRLTSRPSI